MAEEIYLGNALWQEPKYEPEFWIVLTALGEEPANYPVDVLDINGNVIGVAADKDEYMEIWNGDPTNTSARGYLIGEPYPFVFLLTKIPEDTIIQEGFDYEFDFDYK